MGHILEAIFRRPLHLLMLIMLLPAMSVALVYFVAPRTYQSTAKLWASNRFAIIGTTSRGSDQLAAAAQTQAAALSELLQTRSFALTVAHETAAAGTLNLDSSARSAPQMLDDALFGEISRNVTVNAQGDSLFEISYANRDPRVAQHVVEAIVKTYGSQGTDLSVLVDQRLLESYQKQLAIAEQDANAAVAAESTYLLEHPKLSQNPNVTPSQLLTDPNYALLDQKRVQAQSILQNLENNIATLKQTISDQSVSSNSLFEVIDAPKVASRPVSRLKLLLIAGGIGLAVAMLGCAFYIVISARRDHGVYTDRDLQKVTDLPVAMQLPRLTSSTMPLLVEESVLPMTGRRGAGRTTGQL